VTSVEFTKTVLVVEDDADVRDAIAVALSIDSYLVQVAASREAALQIIAGNCPNVIILDWFMPGILIEDFVPMLRSKCPNSQIVLISASFKVKEKSKELGIPYFLPKPFEIDDLLGIVGTCVNAPKN
jgi:DNA-binding NtrC family response regulator